MLIELEAYRRKRELIDHLIRRLRYDPRAFKREKNGYTFHGVAFGKTLDNVIYNLTYDDAVTLK